MTITKKQLLDSFKNYQVVRKPGKDIRPGDSVLIKSIGSLRLGNYSFSVDSFIVKAVNIQSWHDGSIEVEVRFHNQTNFINNYVVLNGHNYYDTKVYN